MASPWPALIAAVAPLTMLLALDNAEHLLAGVAHLCNALKRSGTALAPSGHQPGAVETRAPSASLRIGPLAVPDIALPVQQALRVRRSRLVRRTRAGRRPALRAERRRRTGRDRDLSCARWLAAGHRARCGESADARDGSACWPRCRRGFGLLTASRNRNAPARQQTLRSALEWSYGLLEPAPTKRFSGASACSLGSASLELIQQVLVDPDDGAPLDSWAVLDALDALVDRSLVAVSTSADARRAPLPPARRRPAPTRSSVSKAPGEPAREMQRRHALAVAAAFDAAYEEYFSGRIGVADWLRRQRRPIWTMPATPFAGRAGRTMRSWSCASARP